jgi:hypothetical protein
MCTLLEVAKGMAFLHANNALHGAHIMLTSMLAKRAQVSETCCVLCV